MAARRARSAVRARRRPDRFAKAAERSDCVIVDLEDGAALDGHEAARRNVLENPLDPARTILRVTGPDTPTFAGDVELARQSTCTASMAAMPLAAAWMTISVRASCCGAR